MDKKYMATFVNGPTNVGDTIHFGASGYDDFTTHGDVNRKYSYIARHTVNEDWTKRGMHTAGFWAKHMLWNELTLKESAKDLSQRFGFSIHLMVR